jgi:anaerobic magnesium-protoporphyrin IX monomethyl ester cyclase
MKIALVNPNKSIRHPSIHLGLGYLASFVLENTQNIEIQILDTRVAKPKEISAFFRTKFDLVGITATSQVFMEAAEISDIIKSKFPDTHICIGGPHASTVKEEALEGFSFDYAVFGEGEHTFSQLIQYLTGKIKIEVINGLIYRNKERKIIVNPVREIIADIDTLPIPAYHLFHIDRYSQHRLVTSRGCPFDCVFCNSSKIWTRKWRMRNPDLIIEEMKFLISNFGKKTFVFNDDSFNINQKRVSEFCDGIISNNMNVLWSVPIRVDLITDEMAIKMKKTGCYSVSIGIESANNGVLKMINKNITTEKIYKGIQILNKAGIDITGQFMIGNPGDTLDTIKESIQFAQNSNLTNIEFYTAMPYKGSALWQYVQQEANMLTNKKSYHYHEIEPRIIFETNEFSLKDRLEAVELAKNSGFYNALLHDDKSSLLDFGKWMAGVLQKTFSGKFGNKIYLKLRNLYRRILIL